MKAPLLFGTALAGSLLGIHAALAENENCTPAADTSSGAIQCGSGAYASIYYNPASGDTNLTVASGATVLGSNENSNAGISVGYPGPDQVNLDANVTIDSAAMILSTGQYGLIGGASGAHTVQITNSGPIGQAAGPVATRGIRGEVDNPDPAGPATVSITNAATGTIYAQYEGIQGYALSYQSGNTSGPISTVDINNAAAISGLNGQGVTYAGIQAEAEGGNQRSGVGTGVIQIQNSGTITSLTDGIIATVYAPQNASITIQNSGAISAAQTLYGNNAGITATAYDLALGGAASVSISNSAVVRSQFQGLAATGYGDTTNVSISNSGTVSVVATNQNYTGSNYYEAGITGVTQSSAGSLIIDNTGKITAMSAGGNDPIYGIAAIASFDEGQTFSNTTASAAVENDGSVTVNGNNGVTSNGSVGVIIFSQTSSTLTNTGTITATDADAAVVFVVLAEEDQPNASRTAASPASAPAAPTGIATATAPATLTNSGLIENDTVGGVAVLGDDQPTTITNSGTITLGPAGSPIGGTAIQLGAAANTLILEPGSVIQGLVTNGDTTSTTDQNGNTVTSLTVNANNTLNLGGAGTATFDTSQIAETPAQLGGTPTADGTQDVITPAPTETQQYQGFSTFIKSGPSTWILTYGTGGGLADQDWTITGGTLQGDTDSIRGAQISDGGTLAFVQDFDGTYAGQVSDAPGQTGAFVKGGTGTLTLTGAQTYSGTTTVEGGTLLGGGANVFSAASVTTIDPDATLDLGGFAQTITTVNLAGGTLQNGALTSTVNATGGTINNLGGPASLNVTTGLTNAVGVNTYTGATTITAGGDFIVLGSVTASDITVGNGGTLSGTGKIGDPTIQAGGTLAPGSAANPTGTLTIVGPLTFAAGSTYQIALTPTANSRTDVTGTTTIGGGTVNVLAGAGTYAPTRYTLLTATGGVTGRFAGLTTTSNLVFLTPMLTYDADDVFLTLARTTAPTGSVVTFPSVAATANQRATAGAIEALGAGALYTAVLNQTSGAGARAAFDATSGEIHASAVTAGIEDTRLVRDSIFGRLDDAARDAGPGARGALTPFGGLAPTLPQAAQGYAPVHKGYDMPVAAPPPPAAPAYAVWGTGFGDFGSNGGNGNAATLDRSLGGFVAGIDTRVDWAGLSAWRIGVAGGYTSDDLSVRDRGSSGTFETYFGGLYAGAQYGAVDIKLGALGGGTSTTTNRSVAFPGFTDATHSGNDGTIAQGFGELGYKIALRSGYIEPLFQGAAIHIGQDGFRENGGAAALVGFGHDTDVETTTLGLKSEAALPFAGLPLVARAFVGWRHAFGDVDPVAVEAFAAGGPAFTIAGAPIDRDAVVADIGLDYRFSQAVTLGVSYDGQAGRRADDNAVRGNVEVKF